jgi:iron-sulfur cluster insertion protein
VGVVRVLQMHNIISVDKTAIDKINESENTNYFRVFVTGGGCSGFKYEFKFEDEKYDDDFIIDVNNDKKVLIDPISYQYIAGSTLFYERSLMGEYFTVNNPNAKQTCGCGSSFEF